MTIFLPRTNSLILEVPKTGSKWVRAAIQRAGIPFNKLGPRSGRGTVLCKSTGADSPSSLVFVRSPVDWHRWEDCGGGGGASGFFYL